MDSSAPLLDALRRPQRWALRLVLIKAAAVAGNPITDADRDELASRLEDPATEDDLVRVLLDAYDIDKERAATDVAAFVADLRQRELIAE